MKSIIKRTVIGAGMLCGLSFFCLPGSLAQETPVRFGIKSGVNFSFFTRHVDGFGRNARTDSYKSDYNTFFRTGIPAALNVEFNFSEQLAFDIEAAYSPRGMAYRQPTDFYVYDQDGNSSRAHDYYTYRLEFFETPITVKVALGGVPEDGRLRVYAGVAPAWLFDYSAKLTFDRVNGQAYSGRDFEYMPPVNRFNVSALGGLQWVSSKRKRGEPSFLFDFRTSYAWLPVFQESRNADLENLRTGMITFSLGAGILF
ncbi:porin family protein [Pedobacter sp. SYP-B3415]|uniref:porin family protein n=1 Tax=Pedobacter sp. SYP-B3415 TaxID=2496641 RepID=UPI00101C2EAD|nr:porin family protein [Pedobacter sp. SYP-B3415]